MTITYEYDLRPKGNGSYRIRMPARSPGLAEAMRRYLEKRNLSYGLATYNGWYPSAAAGDDLPRIVIPGTMVSVVTPNGLSRHRGRFWQARAMIEGEPRYQSPGGEKNGAVITVRPYERTLSAVMVEGPMDALAAAECGYLGIAVMNNAPALATLESVVRELDGIAEVTLMPDLDSPGAFIDALKYLGGGGLKSRIIWPTSKDLAACSRSERLRLLCG